MAVSNFQVANFSSAIVTFQAFATASAWLVNMSIPTNTLGSAMLGSNTMSFSLPVTIATDQVALPVAAATVPLLLTVSATAGVPAAVNIKASAGTLKTVALYNNNTTAPVFLKMYNILSASVSSASVPLFTIGVPPGAPYIFPLGDGGSFTTAMSYIITKLIVANDTTPVAINDLNGIITFI